MNKISDRWNIFSFTSDAIFSGSSVTSDCRVSSMEREQGEIKSVVGGLFECQRRWHDRWFSFKMQHISGTRLVSNSFRFIWICELSSLSVKTKSISDTKWFIARHQDRGEWKFRKAFSCSPTKEEIETKRCDCFLENSSSALTQKFLNVHFPQLTKETNSTSPVVGKITWASWLSHICGAITETIEEEKRKFSLGKLQTIFSDFSLKIQWNTNGKRQEQRIYTWLASIDTKRKYSEAKSLPY